MGTSTSGNKENLLGRLNFHYPPTTVTNFTKRATELSLFPWTPLSRWVREAQALLAVVVVVALMLGVV